jgi:Ras-related protein Rab-11A
MNLFNKLSKWIKHKFTADTTDIDKDPNILEYKILVIGDRSVGKSSICTRFALNEFNLEIKPTTQTECFSRAVRIMDQIIKIYLIDIEESIMRTGDRTQLYADVKGALIVYDVTKTKTFEKVENSIIDLRQKTSLNLPIILVGNKSDLSFLKNVDYEEGLDKAETLTCEFMETSCVDLNQVKHMMQLLIAKIYYGDLSEGKKKMIKDILMGNENKEGEPSYQNSDNDINVNRMDG